MTIPPSMSPQKQFHSNNLFPSPKYAHLSTSSKPARQGTKPQMQAMTDIATNKARNRVSMLLQSINLHSETSTPTDPQDPRRDKLPVAPLGSPLSSSTTIGIEIQEKLLASSPRTKENSVKNEIVKQAENLLGQEVAGVRLLASFWLIQRENQDPGLVPAQYFAERIRKIALIEAKSAEDNQGIRE